MTKYRTRLEAMADDELSAEWVAVMTAEFEPGNRETQLAAIDAVAEELNSRYEQTRFASLAITPKDAKAVTDHLKRWIQASDSDWFGPGEEADV